VCYDKFMLLPIKDKFIRVVANQLGFIGNISKRVRVEADIETFNFKEDESVWNQKQGNSARVFTVYFDDTFVTGFNDGERPEITFTRFSKALRDLAKEGKVVLNDAEATTKKLIESEVAKMAVKDRKDKIEAIPATNKTQKMAKEVVKRANRRVSTKRRK